MNLNEIQSPFQLQGCIIRQIEEKNNLVFLPSTEQLETTVNIKNAFDDIRKNEQDNCLETNFILDLNFTAVSNEKEKEYSIHIVLDGFFTFSKDDEDEFKNMLLLNGNSALYSIARSYIITISSISLTSGQFVLPMINFVKLLEESKKAKNNE